MVQKYYKFVVEDIKIPLKSILKLFNVSLACSTINLGTNLKKKTTFYMQQSNKTVTSQGVKHV